MSDNVEKHFEPDIYIHTCDVVHLPSNSLIHTNFTTSWLHNVFIFVMFPTCIRGKNGSTEHSKGNKKSTRKSGYNTYRGWGQTDYQNKHYNIDQKDEGTWADQRRDGGTNCILRIKEQETRLTLHEHDDYDDDIYYIN